MCNAWNHPPGCTCGWGGEGHAGSSSGGWGYTTPTPTYRPGITREWRERDFTRPSKCPECGAAVFFIRHNGGSVWVDELGWPWPKHACFDKPSEPTYRFTAWSAKSSRLTNPLLGIIKSIRTIEPSNESVVEIEFTDSTCVSLFLRWTPNDTDMAGSLVFVSEEDALLVHQRYAEIPFHSFSRIPPIGSNGWYKCPHCQASVKYGTGHEAFCRKRREQTKAITNKTNVPHSAKTPNQAKPSNLPPHRKPIVVYSARPTHWLTPSGTEPVVATPQPSPPARETLEDRVRAAIESVAKQAWEAVIGIQPLEEQFRQAKHKALELVAMLSPSIKRQVGNAFTSDRWQPLLLRRPKV